MSGYLAVVACGAPLAARVHEVAAEAIQAGWQARVVATPAAMNWVSAPDVEQVTGYEPLVDQRQPSQAKRFPTPDQVVVCPATFNSVNKLATGIMDTYAAGVVCEALASGTPLTIVPMVSTKLWGHPAWRAHLTLLAEAGVTFLDTRSGRAGFPEPVESGTGGAVSDTFDPAWITAAVERPVQNS